MLIKHHVPIFTGEAGRAGEKDCPEIGRLEFRASGMLENQVLLCVPQFPHLENETVKSYDLWGPFYCFFELECFRKKN